MRTFLMSMLAVLVMSVAAADPVQKDPLPISAIAVTECGRAVVIFVTLDGKPVAIETAMTIALKAKIQVNVSLPCHENEI